MKTFAAALALLAIVYTTTTEACSCSRFPNRRESLTNGVCGGDVYTATVISAMCNCLPDTTQDSYNLTCQDYRLQGSGSTVVTTELVARAQCSGRIGSDIRRCSELAGNLTIQGYTVLEPAASNVTVDNTTLSSGFCHLSCPFNEYTPDDPDNYEFQPCFYVVSISEVFRGNYTVGQTLMVPGPDVLTSCGEYGRVLAINQQYVAGVGGACSVISGWSTLDTYSANELQELRSLSERFEAGALDCGAFGLLPSFSAVLTAAVVITLWQSLLA